MMDTAMGYYTMKNEIEKSKSGGGSNKYNFSRTY